MDRAVVLLSGGLDSAVALAKCRAEGSTCDALLIAYGQRHARELAYAEALAARYDATVTRVTVDLPLPPASNALTGSAVVPRRRSLRTIAESGPPPTFVPGRNLVLLSLAFSLAAAKQADRVVMGATLDDAAGYPDCRPRFLTEIDSAAKVGTGHHARLDAPWVYKTKAEVIAEGATLNVDFAGTWSCYQPSSDLHCGVCDACVVRRAGFVRAGVADPTVYAEAP